MQVTCKIVFDSDAEKAGVIRDYCPGGLLRIDDMPTIYNRRCGCAYMRERRDCAKCWEESGIEMEVKSNGDNVQH